MDLKKDETIQDVATVIAEDSDSAEAVIAEVTGTETAETTETPEET
jgi:hypothetical protein